MTYFITALENTKARLIHSETRTTDETVAAIVAEHYAMLGFIVVTRKEG